MVSFRKEYQIKKIVWDGDRWRDLETGVIFNGEPPQEVAAYPEDVQPDGWHHPFDKSYAVTYEQVQKMIADAFEQRVIPEYPHYFIGDHWIVTYEWLKRESDLRQARIDDLQYQIDRLWRKINKPWWKRW